LQQAKQTSQSHAVIQSPAIVTLSGVEVEQWRDKLRRDVDSGAQPGLQPLYTKQRKIFSGIYYDTRNFS